MAIATFLSTQEKGDPRPSSQPNLAAATKLSVAWRGVAKNFVLNLDGEKVDRDLLVLDSRGAEDHVDSCVGGDFVMKEWL
jgi:hypothetical protein